MEVTKSSYENKLKFKFLAKLSWYGSVYRRIRSKDQRFESKPYFDCLENVF